VVARIVCVASAKGGSGKTVLTATLGQFLGALGKRVLLVDCDAATNGLTLLYLREVIRHRDAGAQVGTSLCGSFELNHETVFRPVPLTGYVHLLPATYRLENTEAVPPSVFRGELEYLLASVRGDYSFVFLDAQAGEDTIAQIAMEPAISDEVVLVTEYDPISAAGVDRLKGHLSDTLTYERTWVLINKMLPEFAATVGDFLEVVRYLNPVPWDANVVRAYARRSLALDLERGNDYTLAVTRTMKGLLGPDGAGEVDRWLASRASALREPIREQITDAEMELRGLKLELVARNRTESRRKLLWITVTTYCGVGVATLTYLLANTSLAVTIFASVAVVATLSSWFLTRDRLRVTRISDDLDETRLRRRETALEERLGVLEGLLEASPEVLLTEGQGDRG
jgi:cellulose biosynthesis protein BcsQ